MSAPAVFRRPRSRSSSRGYASRSSEGPNWSGLTKMLTTTTSAFSRAIRTSDRWPSWSAPIVGTKPTDEPRRRTSERADSSRGPRSSDDHPPTTVLDLIRRLRRRPAGPRRGREDRASDEAVRGDELRRRRLQGVDVSLEGRGLSPHHRAGEGGTAAAPRPCVGHRPRGEGSEDRSGRLDPDRAEDRVAECEECCDPVRGHHRCRVPQGAIVLLHVDRDAVQ